MTNVPTQDTLLLSGAAPAGGSAARPAKQGAPLMGRVRGLLTREAREALLVVVLVLAVVGATRLLVHTVQVRETSMLPTLQNRAFVLVDTLSYRLHPPRRGDIIVFHPPADQGSRDYVKRVIGLPGERVAIRHGTVTIQGKILREPYLRRPHTYSWGPARVPAGSLFVLGDNRDASNDSHLWRDDRGRPAPFLAESRVVGRVLLAYEPPAALHLVAAQK
jgi:signal peptidase I